MQKSWGLFLKKPLLCRTRYLLIFSSLLFDHIIIGQKQVIGDCINILGLSKLVIVE
jgi:hypothetical protein